MARIWGYKIKLQLKFFTFCYGLDPVKSKAVLVLVSV